MPRNTNKVKSKRPYRKRRQCGGFLNRYDFSYAGRDTVNQLGKIVPGVIKDASSQINTIAQQRMNQSITECSKELERLLPKILRGRLTTFIKHRSDY